MPLTADTGRAPVAPIGKVRLSVPPKTGLSAKAIVGAPLIPLPLVTAIWLDVPAIVTALTAPADEIVIKPFALRFAKFRTCPSKAMVGLPEMPLPFVIAKPEPETAIERLVRAVEDVLTWNPVPELTKDKRAPVVVILKSP